MLAPERMENYWLQWLVGMPCETALTIVSLIFGCVLERLPDLRIAFAHSGGAYPALVGRLEHDFNVRPDLVAIQNEVNPKEYIGKFTLDSLVHDADMLRYLIGLVGAQCIALGSDYPFPLGEPEPGFLIESMDDFSAETKERLLAGTALEWLGQSKEMYDR